MFYIGLLRSVMTWTRTCFQKMAQKHCFYLNLMFYQWIVYKDLSSHASWLGAFAVYILV